MQKMGDLKGKTHSKIGGGAEQPSETGSSAQVVVAICSPAMPSESVWPLSRSGALGDSQISTEAKRLKELSVKLLGKP